jgi:hypothetical protein
LLYVGREELGIKGILLFIGIWAALVIGLPALGLSGNYSTVIEALIDIILVIIVFGGDINIR